MKKPFLRLKTKKEKRSLMLSLCLSLAAISLFFLPEKSVLVFADGGHGSAAISLFELVCQWL